MDKNITIAKRNEMVRAKAMEELQENGLQNFLQVAGTKYAIDVEVQGEVFTCRVDLVVPKEQGEENTAQYLNDLYLEDLEQKEITKKEKEIAKQKKIAKDTATRAKAKENKNV